MEPRMRKPGLNGAFLMLVNHPARKGTEESAPAFYQRMIKEMADLGMTTIIVQTIFWLTPNGAEDPLDPSIIDAVIEEVKKQNMKRERENRLVLYVGLALSGAANGATYLHPGVLAMLRERAKESAWKIRERCAILNETWAGWYIPLEPWTPYSNASTLILRDYLVEISKYCKQVAADKRVLISPFIAPEVWDKQAEHSANIALFMAEFPLLLRGTSIDVIALQDGVGACMIDLMEGAEGAGRQDRMKQFYEALVKVCAKIDVWGNVESFWGESTTTWSRLEIQIRTVQRANISTLVTYEFAKYWTSELQDAYRDNNGLPPRPHNL